MYILKNLGYLLIFFSFSYTGYAIYLSKKKCLRRVEGLCELIRFIKQRAEYFLDPLDEIYREFRNKDLEICGFNDCLLKYGFEKTYTLFEASFAFDEFLSSSITVFASSLGKFPIKEQISSCEFIISLLEEEISSRKKTIPKDKKLWCGIGSLAGIAFIILLI